jgi:hypothetical protein
MGDGAFDFTQAPAQPPVRDEVEGTNRYSHKSLIFYL